MKIKLNNDFKIYKNKVEGFPERYQSTELEISEKDKTRIIQEIKTSADFGVKESTHFLYQKMLGKNNKPILLNYQFAETYYREYYEQIEGYVATSINVSLNENSNILKIERIED